MHRCSPSKSAIAISISRSEEEEGALDKSLTAMVAAMHKGQKFEETPFANGGGLIYDVDDMTLTDCDMTQVHVLYRSKSEPPQRATVRQLHCRILQRRNDLCRGM